jgi:CPA2 family monovalent cation:H+ antiporter-2
VGDSAALLEDLAVVLIVAAAVTVVFRWLRQPVTLGYLLAGLIVGPHTPSIPLIADHGRVQTLSELGVILVMFAIGLHVNLRALIRLLPTAGLTGALQIAGMMWLGFLIGRAAGGSTIEALFVGAIVSISSTMVATRALDEAAVEAAVRELVVGVLIVQDLAAVLLIALLTTLAQGGAAAGAMLDTALELVGFLVATLAIGIVLVPRAIRAVARLGSGETLLLAATGLAFALALIAHHLGFSVALGAFLAGSLIAESGHAEEVERLVTPLRDLFAAVFFVAVGMIVDPRAIASHLGLIVALVAVVLIGTPLLVAIGTFLAGNSLRAALRTGLTLAQVGEFSFILAGVGIASGAVGAHLMPVAVAVAAATSFSTAVLVARGTAIARAIEARLPTPVRTFATLYVGWREQLRDRPAGRSGSRLWRLVALLVADGAVLAAIAIGAHVVADRHLGEMVRWSGLTPSLAGALILAIAAAVGLPFGFGWVRCAGAIGALLATRVLPAVAPGALDLAAAPRRALVMAFRLAATLLIGVPLLALAQTLFVGSIGWLGAAILGGLLVVQGVWFWRGAENLAAHVSAGTQLVVEVLGRGASPADDARALDQVGEQLPGLGRLTAVHLVAGTPAIGRTLVELDLRGRTGATVLAIHRREGAVVAPTGREVLEVGDVLSVTGGNRAVDEARAILIGGGAEAPPA